ncbi:MAG: hypothetical protein ACI8QC_001394 [Planctomycetota bacterium]|jgi:hypothetical protein
MLAQSERLDHSVRACKLLPWRGNHRLGQWLLSAIWARVLHQGNLPSQHSASVFAGQPDGCQEPSETESQYSECEPHRCDAAPTIASSAPQSARASANSCSLSLSVGAQVRFVVLQGTDEGLHVAWAEAAAG